MLSEPRRIVGQRATVALDSSTRTRFLRVAAPSRFSSRSITSLHTTLQAALAVRRGWPGRPRRQGEGSTVVTNRSPTPVVRQFLILRGTIAVLGDSHQPDPTMARLLLLLLGLLRSAYRSRADLMLENVALRHQLGVLMRAGRRPRVTAADRWFWVVLRRLWSRWSEVLAFVKPETVVRWHRAGFRLYWNWLSRRDRRGPCWLPMPSGRIVMGHAALR
jgi:hypothetical protein